MKQEEMYIEDIKIEGIDRDVGSELYEDDVDLYLSVLRSFVKNTPSTLEAMSVINKDDLKSYTYRAHGLKSVCAFIGAESLSDRAHDLEIASSNKELDTVVKDNPKLLQDVNALIQNINNFLANVDE